jgi:hypothetical protein
VFVAGLARDCVARQRLGDLPTGRQCNAHPSFFQYKYEPAVRDPNGSFHRLLAGGATMSRFSDALQVGSAIR